MASKSVQVSKERDFDINLPLSIIPQSFRYWEGHRLMIDDYDRYFKEFQDGIGLELALSLAHGGMVLGEWQSSDSIMTISYTVEVNNGE